MASVLGLTALLGAMRSGTDGPPPQGDSGGSGGAVNGVTPGAEKAMFTGFSRFRVLLTMQLLVLGLAGTASAQSSASELEDGGAPYFVVTGSPFFNTFEIRIQDTGSGNINVEVKNIAVFPNVTLGTQAADDSSGYFVGATNSELTFVDGSGEVVGVHIGTSGTDIMISGGHDAELFFGMNGDDEIDGSNVFDLIFGGNGGDILNGYGGGNDVYAGFRSIRYPSSNSDYITVDSGMNFLFADDNVGGTEIHGGDDMDFIHGGASYDSLHGEGGGDWIWGGGSDDYIIGGPGCDNLFGDEEDAGFANPLSSNPLGDTIYGGTEDDLIRGEGGGDYLLGEDGDDCIDGGDDADAMWGGDGNDYLHDMDGTGGDDLNGEDGDDYLHSTDSSPTADDLDGGNGANSLYFDDPDDNAVNGAQIQNSHPTGYTLTPPSFTNPFEYFAIGNPVGSWWGVSTGVAGPRTCS